MVQQRIPELYSILLEEGHLERLNPSCTTKKGIRVTEKGGCIDRKLEYIFFRDDYEKSLIEDTYHEKISVSPPDERWSVGGVIDIFINPFTRGVVSVFYFDKIEVEGFPLVLQTSIRRTNSNSLGLEASCNINHHTYGRLNENSKHLNDEQRSRMKSNINRVETLYTKGIEIANEVLVRLGIDKLTPCFDVTVKDDRRV